MLYLLKIKICLFQVSSLKNRMSPPLKMYYFSIILIIIIFVITQIRDANFKKSLNFDNLNFHDNLVKRNENLQRFSLKSINEISFVPHPLQKIIPDKILQNNLINDDDSIWTDKDTLGTMSNEEDSHLRKTQFLRTKKKICKIKNFNSLQNFWIFQIFEPF